MICDLEGETLEMVYPQFDCQCGTEILHEGRDSGPLSTEELQYS